MPVGFEASTDMNITTLRTIDDALATRLLRTVAGPRIHLQGGSKPIVDGVELAGVLIEAFGIQEAVAARAPSDGELARAALAVVAGEPGLADVLEEMLDTPAPVMGVGETIAILTAALVVLQSHVKIERSAAGKWKVLVEKKAASDALLKGLAQAVAKALSAGGGEKRLPPAG